MDLDHVPAVLAAFGLPSAASPPTFVARGAMGEVWRVDTGGGPVAIKALLPWVAAPARPDDVGVQLAAAAAGVPLPQPLLSDDGAAVVVCDGRRYRAYDWVDLASPLHGPIARELAVEAGSHLGTLHALALGAGRHAVDDVDAWYRVPPSKDRLAALARAGTADARHWSYALIASFGLIDELLTTVGYVTESPVAPPIALPTGTTSPPIVSHRDFNLDNVIPSADDGSLVVIDWENAGPIQADQELALALVEVATGQGSVDEPSALAFVEAYRSAGGTAVVDGGSSFRMAVCAALNYLVVLAEQALSDDPYAEEALGELLAGALPNLASVVPGLATICKGR